MRRACACAALLAASWSALPAAAQFDDDYHRAERNYASPENYTVEFRLGPYRPNDTDDFYNDPGIMLEFELDVIAFRLDEIAYFAVGGIAGWAGYDTPARTVDGMAVEEDNTLDVVPLSLMAVVRVDVLARKLSIPFYLTGKLGYEWMFWDIEKGDQRELDGIGHGLRWAGQVALDLDFFEPRTARRMDEDWGINHSFVFFELYGARIESDELDLGDTAWSAGLGFIF